MTPDEEIADIERCMFGMSHGHIEYPVLNQRLIALRLAQKEEREKLASNAPDTKDHWYNKPLGQIFIATVGGFLVLCLAYLVFAHVGIRL